MDSRYLISIDLKRDQVPSFKHYPFHLPAVRFLPKLDCHPAVTFLIGENGSGKSTLLEAVAIALGFNAEGGTKNFQFATHQTHSELHQYLRIGRGFQRPRDGFFFRAESFYNVASEVDRLNDEPLSPPLVASYGGKSLHEQSHGESFFALFNHRFGGRGLYILDEPEAALSPRRQLAFITRLHDLVEAGSQFLIATHSPIIMAYPQARIYSLKESEIVEETYQETGHYRLTKSFLDRPEAMLRHLMAQ